MLCPTPQWVPAANNLAAMSHANASRRYSVGLLDMGGGLGMAGTHLGGPLGNTLVLDTPGMQGPRPAPLLLSLTSFHTTAGPASPGAYRTPKPPPYTLKVG